MRVGITGASGLIGRTLVEALRERNEEVVRFVRPGGSFEAPVVRWDPSRGLIDDGDLTRVGRMDALVHLAGAGIGDRRWTEGRKREILDSRTKSTDLLVEAMSTGALSTPHFVSGSAIGYYGSRGDNELDETSSRGEGFLANVCVKWESSALRARTHGTDVTLLRTGIVMSDLGGALKSQLPFFRFGLGGRLAKGRQWLSPISLRDEVRAILWTIDHQLVGPVNLTSPAPLRNSDFTRALGQHLHRPTIARVPALALQVALGVEFANELLLASERVIPRVLSECGFTFNNPDIASILKSALTHGP